MKKKKKKKKKKKAPVNAATLFGSASKGIQQQFRGVVRTAATRCSKILRLVTMIDLCIAINLCRRNEPQPFRNRQYYETILLKYSSTLNGKILEKPFIYEPTVLGEKKKDETEEQYQERGRLRDVKKQEFNRVSLAAFDVYQSIVVPNPGLLESRSKLNDILAESFNSTLPTDFKNTISMNFKNRQESYMILKLQTIFPSCKIKYLSQYSRRVCKCINYGISFPWDFLGLADAVDDKIILKTDSDGRLPKIKTYIESKKGFDKNDYKTHPAFKSHAEGSVPKFLLAEISNLNNGEKQKLVKLTTELIKEGRSLIPQYYEESVDAKCIVSTMSISCNPQLYLNYLYKINKLFEENRLRKVSFEKDVSRYNPPDVLEKVDSKTRSERRRKCRQHKEHKRSTRKKNKEELDDEISDEDTEEEGVIDNTKKLNKHTKPFNLVPVKTAKTGFIIITKKNVKGLYGLKRDEEKGWSTLKQEKYWWDVVFNVTKCLHRVDNEEDLREIKSIKTNGVEVHVLLKNRGMGVVGPTIVDEKQSIVELQKLKKKPLYNAEDVYISLEELQIMELIGVDPNLKNLAEWVRGNVDTEGKAEWQHDKSEYGWKKTMSNGHYQHAIGVNYRRVQDYRYKRSNKDLKHALEELSSCTYRSTNIEDVYKYLTVYHKHLKVFNKYHYRINRIKTEFLCKMKKQSTLSRLADFILFNTKRSRKNPKMRHPVEKMKKEIGRLPMHERQKLLAGIIVYFGAGSFKNGHSYAPIPRKMLIRVLIEKGALVLLTNEHNTTKNCSTCGEKLLKPSDEAVKPFLRNNIKWSGKDVHNVRCCTSVKHNDSGCETSSLSCIFMGRDLDSAKSIGQRGVKDTLVRPETLAAEEAPNRALERGYQQCKAKHELIS